MRGEVNEKGHLVFGGCDTVKLANTFGTPLYVMDEDYIRDRCRGYVKALKDNGLEGMAVYASKAFLNMAMVRIIAEEGMGLDVVSGGELYTAYKAGFDLAKVFFHGNNKTPEEIAFAVEHGVGRIVIDHFAEIDMVEDIAKKRGKHVNALIRVKPGVDAHTHHYIQTGKQDSKFGFGISDGQAMEAAKWVMASKHIQLVGLHCHIGSQIFELKPFGLTAEIMEDFRLALFEETGELMEEINFGGGYGIHYTDADHPLDPLEYIKEIADALKARFAEHGLALPRFIVEPGRSIVGEAGITLYTLGSIKDIPGIRTYVSVDGGMGDNPRPALYQAKYEAVVANKAKAEAVRKVTVAGRCCESGDMLIHDIALPEIEVGDILAVFSTGAYNYSMASNYNRLPVPAVVLAKDGRAELMVRRQTYDDLLHYDEMPSWLSKA